jgi:predicted nucleotidyltransferase
MDVISDIRTILPGIKKRFSVRRIGVFGSYVRGDQNEDSDIDILVEFEKTSFDNYMGLMYYLEEIFGKKIDLVTTRALHCRLKPYIMEEVEWCET